MNDKPGGTPDHFNTTPGANTGSGSPSRPMTNSPSNFGAKPAPSAPPVTPISGGPATFGQRPGSISGTPTGAAAGNTAAPGINSANFGGTANGSSMNGANRPGPANFGARRPDGNGVNNGAMNPMGPRPEGLNRPMTKAAMPAATKQKKPLNKKLVIGIACGVVALVLIVGIAVAAMLMLNKSDPVAKAMDKLVASGLPIYMTVKADVNAQMSNDDDIVSHANVSATANLMPATLTNEASATITMGGRNMDDTTFQINEIYAGEDNLFVMFDGLDTAIESYVDAVDYTRSETVSDESEKCVDEYGDAVACDSDEAVAIDDGTSLDDELTDEEDETTDADAEATDAETETDVTEEDTTAADDTTTLDGEASDMLSDMISQLFIGIAQSIDGKWLKIDSDSNAISSTTNGEAVTAEDETEMTNEEGIETTEGEVVGGETIDITELLENTGASTSTIGDGQLTCEIDLVQKIRDNSGTVSEIYRNNPFVSGSNENVALSSKSYPVYRIVIDQEKYAAFIGAMQNQGLLNDYTKCSKKSVTEITNFPSQMPTIYTEVDNNSNFTRFYLATTNDGTTLTMNFDLSYPANINVKEPQNYVTLQEALQQAVVDMMEESGLGDIGVLNGLEEGAMTTETTE